jgi:ethanolamine utilization protein EutN
MRIARVIGTVTLSRKLPDLRPGQLLIAEAFDGHALRGTFGEGRPTRRDKPMPEALVVFDQLGAGVGQAIAVSEGREACMPFWPDRVPIDAYSAAIIDEVSMNPSNMNQSNKMTKRQSNR